MLVYDGTALTEGRIPVRDLAPSLFALAALFDEANEVLNPPGVTVTLDIRATEPSSFDVLLVLHSAGHWLTNLFTSDEADALSNFKDLIIGAGFGLFAFVQWLKRREIEAEQELNADETRVVLKDGTEVTVRTSMLRLYKRLTVRETAREVIKVLDADGIDRLEIRESDNEVTVTLTADDVPEFEVESQPANDELLVDETGRVALTIETLPLTHPGATWRFHDGARSFKASMDDPTFAESVGKGEVTFTSGDILLADVRRRQYRTDTGRLRNEWAVVSVEGQISAHPITVQGPVGIADTGDPTLELLPPSGDSDDGSEAAS